MAPALLMQRHAMLNLRTPKPDSSPSDARFRVLLTEDRARPDEHWTRQLPQLVRPLGVQASIAADSKEALAILESTPIHAAVIDLNTPAPQSSDSGSGGLWCLYLLAIYLAAKKPGLPKPVIWLALICTFLPFPIPLLILDPKLKAAESDGNPRATPGGQA